MSQQAPDLWPLLKSVSRSFYLSMVFLPAPMRRGVAVAYLLARAADSVADTSSADLPLRLSCLRGMETLFAGCLSAAARAELLAALQGGLAACQAKASERELLSRFGECLALFEALPAAEQDLIREVLDTIIGGQCWDLSFFQEHRCVESDADTRRYIYAVAGCVGRFWTLLGRQTLGGSFCPPERVAELTEQGEHYGCGLQLINILRDREEDAAMGRCYLRSNADRWSLRALRYLQEGLAYSRSLAMFRLRFTAMLPALIGLKTLEKMRRPEASGQRVKISRKAVYACMLRALWLSARRQGA